MELKNMVFEFSRLIRNFPIGKTIVIKADGCKGTVKVSGYQFANGTWYIITEERGVILLSRLEQMKIELDRPATVGEVLADVINDICDNYCKFPECYEDEDELCERQCDKCPLNRLE